MPTSLIDLKNFFQDIQKEAEHTNSAQEGNQYMEDLLEGTEVKDLDDLAFLEHVEPTTETPSEPPDYRMPIYPYDSPN